MRLPAEINPHNEANAPAAALYRAIQPLAVVSVILGALSILVALAWFLILIPVAGGLLGWQALKQIRKAPDAWTGEELAFLGIGLSIVLGVLGCGWLLFARASEVPYGYTRVTYEMLQPDPNTPTEPLPQSARDMEDKKVFVQGYMQPRRQQTRIKEFILCPSSGECTFCTPKSSRTEMIRVILQGDLETSFTTRLISVAGRFRVEPDDPSGVPYAIEADYIR